jgi:hypothetical protein
MRRNIEDIEWQRRALLRGRQDIFPERLRIA